MQEIWLGAYKDDSSRRFRWDSDKSDVPRKGELYWDNGQPNNDGSCMLMDGGKWWDRECNEQKSAVLCMISQ